MRFMLEGQLGFRSKPNLNGWNINLAEDDVNWAAIEDVVNFESAMIFRGKFWVAMASWHQSVAW